MGGLSSCWRRLPLSARLLLLVGAVLGSAGTGLLLTMAWQDGVRLRAKMSDVAAEERKLVPTLLADALVIGDYAALQRQMDHLARRGDIAQIELRGSDGSRVVSAESVEDSEGKAPAWYTLALGLEDREVLVPMTIGGTDYGVLRITMTAQTKVAAAWSKHRQMLLILLSVLLAEMAATLGAVRESLRPLHGIEAAARAIGQGNLGTRAPEVGSPELRAVALSFNRMADALQESHVTLLQEKNQAEQANRAKHDFLSRMSHELRTPLNAIIGFGQLLDLDSTLTDDQRDNISEMLRAGHHLLGLINEILTHVQDGTPRDLAPAFLKGEAP